MRSSSSSLYQSGDTLHEIAYQRERPDKDFRVWLRELGLLERSETARSIIFLKYASSPSRPTVKLLRYVSARA
jgi:hypothetical protein